MGNSYAKINLFLEVLKRREDGYHEIRTILSEIDLYDEISYSIADTISVNLLSEKLTPTSQPVTIKQEENLVYKVATDMKRRFDVKSGAKIDIRKNIPVSAGLGGGSSNAALSIKALSTLWDLNLTLEQMKVLAAQYGSDVAFFIEGGTALAEGRGEIITKLRDIKLDKILLIKPEYGILSATAYNLLGDLKHVNKKWKLPCAGHTEDLTPYYYNRLEVKVRKHYPEIDKIISHTSSNGALKSLLSGSGSTVIAIYDSDHVLDEHYNHYRNKGFWVYKTTTETGKNGNN